MVRNNTARNIVTKRGGRRRDRTCISSADRKKEVEANYDVIARWTEKEGNFRKIKKSPLEKKKSVEFIPCTPKEREIPLRDTPFPIHTKKRKVSLAVQIGFSGPEDAKFVSG